MGRFHRDAARGQGSLQLVERCRWRAEREGNQQLLRHVTGEAVVANEDFVNERALEKVLGVLRLQRIVLRGHVDQARTALVDVGAVDLQEQNGARGVLY